MHLNLTQGRPLTKTYPAPLLDEEGRFCGIGKLFRHLRRTRPDFESALRSEAAAQIEFLKMRGVHPTHINGHQYVELLPGLRDTLQGLMARYGIDRLRIARERGLARTTLFRRLQAANWALAHVKRFYAVRLEREAQAWNVEFPDAFFGTSHAGRVDLPLVRQFLASGRRARLIEIGLHPAFPGVTVRQPGRRLERSVGDGSPQGTRNADEPATRRNRQIARHVAGPPGRNGNGGRAQSRVATMRAFVSSSNRGRIRPTGVPLYAVNPFCRERE